MDWANERYVRVYTRDTDDWLVLSWDAKAVWLAMMRKFDRAGVLETKRGARGVAALIGAPIDVVERGLPELLHDGCVVEHGLGYAARNFIEAQETPQSDKQRAKNSRERRRSPGVTIRDSDVTTPGPLVTDRDGAVTNRDESSRAVTPRHTASLQTSQSGPDRSDLDPPTHTLISEGVGVGVWDGYAKLYAQRYGAAPTPSDDAITRLRYLVSQHGEDEVLRRARVMLLAPPGWLKGASDVGTLLKNFDKLVGDRAPPRPRPPLDGSHREPPVDDEERAAAAAVAKSWLTQSRDPEPEPDDLDEQESA